MKLDFAREVLRTEAEAIVRISEKLDESFLRAAKLLFDCRDRGGRIVVSGVGKAGLVGAKIAATLSSTGSPALTLNPTDALHGDIGVVDPEDVGLLLSNSGRTEEILRLVPHLRHIGCRVVSICGDMDSPLARPEMSDEVVSIGRITEACPLGLAPSASTTAMLAVGDALALLLQKQRGFRGEDYARFHPAGELGRKLMKVADVMRTDARCPRVSVDAPVGEVLGEITGARAGSASVIDGDGRLLGIFTDGDFRRALAEDREIIDRPVGDVMTKAPKAVGADRLLGEAMAIMRDKKVNELPVVDSDGRVVGLVDIQDIVGLRIV